MKTITMCAPVAAFVAGALLFMSVPAAAADAPPPPEVTSLANSPNPFTQVETTSPEYAALKRLQADGLIRQHADLLKTGQPLTRYQAAVIAAEAINNAKSVMRDGTHANMQLTADDVAALRIVYDDVKNDLTALTARVNADERRLAALESKTQSGQSQTVAQAEAPSSPSPAPEFKPSFEIHGEFRIRPVLENIQVASGTTNTGIPIPDGNTLVRTGTQGDASVTTGSIGNGQMQSRMRLVAAGHVTPESDFIVRLSTEDIGGANNASLVHNDFSFIQYVVPKSGFAFYGGKLLYCCGTPWLPDGTGMIADAVPIGVAMKYTVPGDNPHKISAWASVGSLKNAQTTPTQVTCPPSATGFTQNILAAHAEADVIKDWKLQVQYLQEPSQCVTAFPSGGTLLTNNTNLQVGSFTIDHNFGPLLSATFELLGRFGNDPNTHTGWTDNGALWLGLKYGKFGVPYQTTGDFTYIDSGQNSIPGNLDSIVNGVDSPWNFLLPFPNDVQTIDLGANWFFGPNALLRLEYATAILRHNESTVGNNIITGYRQNQLILTGSFNF